MSYVVSLTHLAKFKIFEQLQEVKIIYETAFTDTACVKHAPHAK
jgi:hypothetical protein